MSNSSKTFSLIRGAINCLVSKYEGEIFVVDLDKSTLKGRKKEIVFHKKVSDNFIYVVKASRRFGYWHFTLQINPI
ncbi:MAG: hypothetical protein QG614_467 [Patescibacteria group bacterium]|nr:hypothetical protein [Patescibacteria group bacterium]